MYKNNAWVVSSVDYSFVQTMPTGVQGNLRPGTTLYLNELCIPVSTVPNLSALRCAARGDLFVLRTILLLF